MPVVDDHPSFFAGTRIAEIVPLIARVGRHNQLLVKIATVDGWFGWGEAGRVLTAALSAIVTCSNRVPRSPTIDMYQDAIRKQTVEPLEAPHLKRPDGSVTHW